MHTIMNDITHHLLQKVGVQWCYTELINSYSNNYIMYEDKLKELFCDVCYWSLMSICPNKK